MVEKSKKFKRSRKLILQDKLNKIELRKQGNHKIFLCSTELSMKFFLLINVKMPTIVGILTFISRKKQHCCLIRALKTQIFFLFLSL